MFSLCVSIINYPSKWSVNENKLNHFIYTKDAKNNFFSSKNVLIDIMAKQNVKQRVITYSIIEVFALKVLFYLKN